MYDTVEFRHLRYFIAVAEEGNFSRAAKRLHLAQPSLSFQIKQLEDSIPAQLFVRENSGIKLTPAGDALMPHAKRLIRIRDQALEATSAINSGKAPPLRLGFSLFINHRLVETAVKSYWRLFPDSKVLQTSDCTARLLELLHEGNLHAALVTLPIEKHGLVVQQIASERLLVCMRKDDPQATQPSVPHVGLAAKLQVSFDPKYHPLLYAHLGGLLSRAGIALEPTRFVSAPSEIQWMVKQGWGYALMQESTVLDPELVCRPIAGVELYIGSAFVYQAASQQPALQLLAWDLKRRFRDAVPSLSPKRPNGEKRTKEAKQMSLLG
jgi:DNA-binding transcriptional LysR family regulator